MYRVEICDQMWGKRKKVVKKQSIDTCTLHHLAGCNNLFVIIFKWIHRLWAETETQTEWVPQMTHQTGSGRLWVSLHTGQVTHSRARPGARLRCVKQAAVAVWACSVFTSIWCCIPLAHGCLCKRCHKSTGLLSSESRAKLTTNVVPLFLSLPDVLTKCFQRKAANGFMSWRLIFMCRDVKWIARLCRPGGWGFESCPAAYVLVLIYNTVLHTFS